MFHMSLGAGRAVLTRFAGAFRVLSRRAYEEGANVRPPVEEHVEGGVGVLSFRLLVAADLTGGRADGRGGLRRLHVRRGVNLQFVRGRARGPANVNLGAGS